MKEKSVQLKILNISCAEIPEIVSMKETRERQDKQPHCCSSSFLPCLLNVARPGSNAFPKRNKLLMSCKCHLENNVYDITKGAANTVSPRIWLSLLNVRKAIMFVVFVSMCCLCMCKCERQREKEKIRESIVPFRHHLH